MPENRAVYAGRTPGCTQQAKLLASVHHRPFPLADGAWAIQMRWTDLLFAHWPVPAEAMASLIPAGLIVDTFDGSAWAGVVPFHMEQVQLRGLPRIPGSAVFAEVNVRTYVRDRRTGDGGVYFFSLDASNPLAVAAARLWYRLPYYCARIKTERVGGDDSRQCVYRSKRLFSRQPAGLSVRYGPCKEARLTQPAKAGSIEYFLTERYCLFAHSRDLLMRADVHHLPWRLASAEAEFETLTLATAEQIELPAAKPLLHYSRRLDVLAWPPRKVG